MQPGFSCKSAAQNQLLTGYQRCRASVQLSDRKKKKKPSWHSFELSFGTTLTTAIHMLFPTAAASDKVSTHGPSHVLCRLWITLHPKLLALESGTPVKAWSSSLHCAQESGYSARQHCLLTLAGLTMMLITFSLMVFP